MAQDGLVKQWNSAEFRLQRPIINVCPIDVVRVIVERQYWVCEDAFAELCQDHAKDRLCFHKALNYPAGDLNRDPRVWS